MRDRERDRNLQRSTSGMIGTRNRWNVKRRNTDTQRERKEGATQRERVNSSILLGSQLPMREVIIVF